MTTSITITEQFCFVAENISISDSQKALKAYSEGLGGASNLENSCPIFLDTNVLLDYYKISFSEREQLEKFFEINKERIFLTKQIENEFLRHRIDHIKTYLKSLEEFVSAYRNIKAEIEKLKIGEIKGFDHYLNNNPILKNDYQDLRIELEQFNETLKNKLIALFQESDFEQQIIEKEKKIEEIKKRLERQADIERNDPLLDIIATFKVVEPLSDEEKNFLKSTYDALNAKFAAVKSDQNYNWKHTFPGCGEKNEKEDPYGDFIIYHEMLKFMKHTNSSVIFLTNDVEKNDWLLRNKTELLPYTHYIVNTFIATHNTMYIFQAKDKIRVSYQAIYIEERNDSKVESVQVVNNDLAITGLKVLGKIDLEKTVKDVYPNSDDSQYSSITENEFLQELSESQKWAENYGNAFVGTASFVNKYLGAKGYSYSNSFRIKDILVDKGYVEEYIHKATNPLYNDVRAIRLTPDGEKGTKSGLVLNFTAETTA